MEVVAAVARAYHGAVLAAESLKTAEQSVHSAEADLERAQTVRAAGMSTDVDVLSIRVHLAAVSEQRIRRAADLEFAKAALNDAMGLPLDTPHTLTTGLEPITATTPATLSPSDRRILCDAQRGLGILREPGVVSLYRVRGVEPVPVGVHQLVPHDDFSAEARRVKVEGTL